MTPTDHSRSGYGGSSHNSGRIYKDDNKRQRKFPPPHHSKYNSHPYQSNSAPPYTQKNSINPFSSRRQEHSGSAPGSAGGSANYPQPSSGESYSSYRSSSHDQGYARNSYSSGGPRRGLGYRSGRGGPSSSLPKNRANGPGQSQHYYRSYSSEGNSGSMNARYSNGYYDRDQYRQEDNYRQGSMPSNDDGYSGGRWNSGSRDRYSSQEDGSSRSGDLIAGPNNRGGDLIPNRDYRYNRGGMRDYRPQRVHSSGGYFRGHYRDDYRSDYREDDEGTWNNRQKHYNYNRYESSTSLEGSKSPLKKPESQERDVSEEQLPQIENGDNVTKLEYPSKEEPSTENIKVEDDVGEKETLSIIRTAPTPNRELSPEQEPEPELEQEQEIDSVPVEVPEPESKPEPEQGISFSEEAEKEGGKSDNMEVDLSSNEATAGVQKNLSITENQSSTKAEEQQTKTETHAQEENEVEPHTMTDGDISKVKESKDDPDNEVDVVEKMDVDHKESDQPNDQEIEKIESIQKDESSTQILGEISEAKISVETVQNTDQACIFPMNKVETKYHELRNVPLSERRKHLKYLGNSQLSDLSQYNFFNTSLLVFKQADGPNLAEKLQLMKVILDKKKKDLTEEYLLRKNAWNKRVSLMDEQLNQFYHTAEEEVSRPETVETTRADEQERPLSGRRGRHHGDTVRTEAEFLEILASLEKERESDPLVKAQHGSAKIPSMIINPVEKYAMVRFFDSNNLVLDKERWADRLNQDPIDTFTKAEHEKFCEAYSMWPKKFGRISNHMGGLRTPEECVLHYYRTKKQVNYKQIVANKNRRATRKASATKRKSRDGKVRNGTQTPETSTNEIASVSLEGTFADPSENEADATDSNKRRQSAPPSSPEPKRAKPSATVSASPSSSNEAAPPVVEPTKVEEETEKTPGEPLEKPKKKRGRKKLNPDGANTVRLADSKDVVPILQSSSGDPLQVARELNEEQKQKVKDGSASSSQASQEASINTYQSADDNDRKKEKHHKDRSHITSYWSVQEISVFPNLLQQYGTDWESMSKHITSKTSTMVRNYYQRGLAENSKWEEMAREADSKRIIDEDKKIAPETAEISDGPPLGRFFEKSPVALKPASEPKPSSTKELPQPLQLPALHTYYPSTGASSAPASTNTNAIGSTPAPETSNDSSAKLPASTGPSLLNISSYPAKSYPLSSLVEAAGSVQTRSVTSPGIAEMNSLLNTALQPPSLRSAQAHLPPLTSTSSVSPGSPFTPKPRSSIRNLLNEESSSNAKPQLYQSSAFGNIMNPAPKVKTESAEQPPHPQATGMSALDALAQVAFERK
ncbi:hypothetical protein OGAPHI_004286 [Ogataea philodendri]|uniref:DNA-binding protein SNT1 n=1 Tax=Ogataea philodendri TaxID=1378263 RepID=A0A9P8P6C3_9ASCO|nr:uncharacterized protein OGAPHI_004286 [Ogataea philodendri]KAH3666097.1 hypothetical protein OGAPHI_004286 [Ogataea philodendri]